jgi:hypothetical protein
MTTQYNLTAVFLKTYIVGSRMSKMISILFDWVSLAFKDSRISVQLPKNIPQ